MPFTKITEFEKSFPGIKSMTPHQKEIAIEVFNSAKKAGDDDGKAIAKAIATAKRSKIASGRDMPMDEDMMPEDMKKKKKKMPEDKMMPDMKMKNKQYQDEAVRSVFLSEVSPLLVSEEALAGKEFEILKTGQFYDSRYGKFEITEKLMDELIENFDSNLLEIDIALDINHDPEKGAFAWLKSLQRRDDRLYAIFRDFTLEGRKFLREKIYKYLSVEFAPFTKIENDKPITYKNVLRGIALTNRPVIKGMSPVFLSETIKVTNQKDMSIVKTFADELLKRDRVSTDDVAMLKNVVMTLSEEEQEEAQPSVDEVEAKADESAEAEAKEAEEKAKAEAEAAAAAAEAAKEAGDPEALQAAETRATELGTKLAEATKLVAQYEEEKRARILSERVEKLTLSEKNPKGFAAPMKDKVSAFLSTLSDEQYTQFSELFENVVSVDLSEKGSGEAGKTVEEGTFKHGETTLPTTGAELDAEIRAFAEREKLSYFDAARKFADLKKN